MARKPYRFRAILLPGPWHAFALWPLLAASALCHVSGGRSVLKKGSFPELRGGGASTTGTT